MPRINTPINVAHPSWIYNNISATMIRIGADCGGDVC